MADILTHPKARGVETRWISCADTAKLIRKALKEAFPGHKFSVRSSTYSMGASIHVDYVDGPTLADVETIAKTFQGAHFDGMTDYKGGHVVALADAPNQPVHFGADFVFVKQDISPAHQAATLAALDHLGDNDRLALEYRLRIGDNAQPFAIPRGDWAYNRAVAVATLPAVVPQASATAASVRGVRSY